MTLAPPHDRTSLNAATEYFLGAARRSLVEPPPGVDPFYLHYNSHLATDLGLRTHVRAMQQMIGLAGGLDAVRGRVVMDVGSGFGMISNLMGVWGARQVIALEIYPPMSSAHRRVVDRDFPELRERMGLVNADARAMPVQSGSVDLLLSIEAISHYFDVDGFLDECARVLRPGGTLLVSDGNNGANPAQRRSTEELWRRYEMGPPGTMGDREVGEPMLARRARMIAERFPQISREQVASLAENTSGMIRDEIVDAVERHLAGGPAPASPYRTGTAPREPEHGYVLETLFDPRTLARDIERRGFAARAVPHYGGAHNDLYRAANRMLSSIPSFRFARAFRIVARRS